MPKKRMALTAAQPRTESPASGWLSWGRMIMRGTTARSWTINMPIMTRLERVPMRPWLIKVLSKTIVLERAIMPPNQVEAAQSQPKSWPMPKPNAILSRIWMGVPIRAMWRTGFSSLRENSMPRAKSSRATPISASNSMSWISTTVMPPVKGPTITPARMYPRIRGCLSCWAISPPIKPATTMMAISAAIPMRSSSFMSSLGWSRSRLRLMHKA